MSFAGAAPDSIQQATLAAHHQQQHLHHQSSQYTQQRENPSPWEGPQDSAADQKSKGQQQSADQQHFLMGRQMQGEHDQQDHQLLQKPKTRASGVPAARPLKPGWPLAARGSLTADVAGTPEEQPRSHRKVVNLSPDVGAIPTGLQRERQQQQQKQQQKQRRRATRRAHVPQLSPAKKQLEGLPGKARTKPATATAPAAATTSCPKQQRSHQAAVDTGAEGLQWPGLEGPMSDALTAAAFGAEQRGNPQQQQSQHLLLRQLPARLALLQHQRHNKQQQQQQQHTEQWTSQQQQLQDFLQLQQRRPQQLQGQQSLHTPTLAYGTLRKKPPTRWKKPSPFGLRVDFPVNPLLQPLLLDNNPFLDSRPTYKGSTRLYEVHVQRNGGDLLHDEHLQLQLAQKQNPPVLHTQEQQQLLLQHEQQQQQQQLPHQRLIAGLPRSSSCDAVAVVREEGRGRPLVTSQLLSCGAHSSSSSEPQGCCCGSFDGNGNDNGLDHRCSRHTNSRKRSSSVVVLQQPEEAACRLSPTHGRSPAAQQQQRQQQQQFGQQESDQHQLQHQVLHRQDGGGPLACCYPKVAQTEGTFLLQQQQHRPQDTSVRQLKQPPLQHQQVLPDRPESLLQQHSDVPAGATADAGVTADAAAAAAAAVAGAVLSPTSFGGPLGTLVEVCCTKGGLSAPCSCGCSRSSCNCNSSGVATANPKGASSLLALLQDPQSPVGRFSCCSSTNNSSNGCCCSRLFTSKLPLCGKGSDSSSPVAASSSPPSGPIEQQHQQQQQFLLQHCTLLHQPTASLNLHKVLMQQQPQERTVSGGHQNHAHQQQQQQLQQQQQGWSPLEPRKQQEGQQNCSPQQQQRLQWQEQLWRPSSLLADWGAAPPTRRLPLSCRSRFPEARAAVGSFSEVSDSARLCCCRGTPPLSALGSEPLLRFRQWEEKQRGSACCSAGLHCLCREASDTYGPPPAGSEKEEPPHREASGSAAAEKEEAGLVAAAAPSVSSLGSGKLLSAECPGTHPSSGTEADAREYAADAAAPLNGSRKPQTAAAAVAAAAASPSAAPAFWQWPGALLLGGLSLLPLVGSNPSAQEGDLEEQRGAAASTGGAAEEASQFREAPAEAPAGKAAAIASLLGTRNDATQQPNCGREAGTTRGGTVPQQQQSQEEKQQETPSFSPHLWQQQGERHRQLTKEHLLQQPPAASEVGQTTQQTQEQPQEGLQLQREQGIQQQHHQQEGQNQMQQQQQYEQQVVVEPGVPGEQTCQDTLSAWGTGSLGQHRQVVSSVKSGTNRSSSSGKAPAGSRQLQQHQHPKGRSSTGELKQMPSSLLIVSSPSERVDFLPEKKAEAPVRQKPAQMLAEGLMYKEGLPVTGGDGASDRKERETTGSALAPVAVPHFDKTRRYSVVELLLGRGTSGTNPAATATASAAASATEGEEAPMLSLPCERAAADDGAVGGGLLPDSSVGLRFMLETPRPNKALQLPNTGLTMVGAGTPPKAHGTQQQQKQPRIEALVHQKARKGFTGAPSQRRKSDGAAVGVSALALSRRQRDLVPLSASRKTKGIKGGPFSTPPKRSVAAATEGRGFVLCQEANGGKLQKQQQQQTTEQTLAASAPDATEAAAAAHLKAEKTAANPRGGVAIPPLATDSCTSFTRNELWPSELQLPQVPPTGKGTNDAWGFCAIPRDTRETAETNCNATVEIQQQKQLQQQLLPQRQQTGQEVACVASCFSGLSDSAVLLWRAAALCGGIPEGLHPDTLPHREEGLPSSTQGAAGAIGFPIASQCNPGPELSSPEGKGVRYATVAKAIFHEDADAPSVPFDDAEGAGIGNLRDLQRGQKRLPPAQLLETLQPPAQEGAPGLAQEYLDFLRSTSIVETSLVSPRPPSPHPSAMEPPSFEPAGAEASPVAPIGDELYRLVF